MIHPALAQYSTLCVYASLLVLGVAFVAFAVDLAQTRHRALGDAEGMTTTSGGAAAGTTASVGAAGGGTDTLVRTAAGSSASPVAPAPGRRQAAGIGLALTRLASLLLLAAVALRGLSVMRAPWGNLYEFLLTAAMLVVLVYVAMGLRQDLRWLGVFVTGLALLVLGPALTVYTEAGQLMPSLRSYWLVVHVSIAILASAMFAIGAALSALYLVQESGERRQSAGAALAGWRRTLLAAVPASRVLDRMAYGLHALAFPLWTFTVIAGAVWAERAWGRYWGWDPKEVWSFIIWVVYAAYLHARATTGWKVRHAAWIALVGFLCIVMNSFVVNKFMTGMHSYSGM
ncbi:c-type cytochrome biogenesis protein CcsB [Arsenicicoccus dermatophilus]|uniref:c-type cytochrome biogenesis protein CcsB n=1 Tax=Arsenicicoccus dermatophilus TaxID=1076331 RepID=UPI003917224B